jgi:mevalonate kinase
MYHRTMKKVTVSAPGKLMLFGEHAVVYGQPCIVTAVGQRMRATAERTDTPSLLINAKDVQIKDYRKPLESLGRGNIPKGARFVEVAVANFHKAYPIKDGGIRVLTSSDFTSTMGFGSSSASVVCVIKALAELSGLKLSTRSLFELCYKTVIDVQKKGSGFDIAAALAGGTIGYHKTGKVIEPLALPSPEPSSGRPGRPPSPAEAEPHPAARRGHPLPGGEGVLPLVIGYSGVKADTVELMKQVAALAQKKPKLVEQIYTQIGQLVPAAKNAMLAGNWQMAGEYMTINQGLLEGLGVSTPKLDAMIKAARSAGAYGAKLSGAGGGDCMIAFVPQEKRASVAFAITQAGGEAIDIPVGVEGAKTED